MNIGLAVGGALASALSFAISSVLQHHGAAQAPDGSGLHLGLLARLMARPLWLLGMLAAVGTAAGIGYGLTASLMKYSVALSQDGVEALLTSWPAYTLLILGAATIILNQAAYQAGPLAGALPVIIIMDSIVAIFVSAAAFHEEVSHHCPGTCVPSPWILHHGAGHRCTRQTGVGPSLTFAGHDSRVTQRRLVLSSSARRPGPEAMPGRL